VDEPARVVAAADDVAKSGNKLFCVILESKLPVDCVELLEEWKQIPIALQAPSFGQYRTVARRLDQFRNHNFRVYLPCRKENLIGIRILASVGIPCCVTFGSEEPDWDALADLMTYAILGSAPHAPIEPFAFIANHYDPSVRMDWGSIYFDDPKQFLHLDAQGRVALSQRDLLGGDFIAERIEEIAAADESIDERLNSWRQLFADNHPCSFCEGWRVCLGKFSKNGTRADGCSAFFAEMMKIAEQFQTKRAEQARRDKWWQ
jgi:hypothetical protein